MTWRLNHHHHESRLKVETGEGGERLSQTPQCSCHAITWPKPRNRKTSLSWDPDGTSSSQMHTLQYPESLAGLVPSSLHQDHFLSSLSSASANKHNCRPSLQHEGSHHGSRCAAPGTLQKSEAFTGCLLSAKHCVETTEKAT